MARRTYAGKTDEQRASERRRRLLDAGARLMARDGAGATTITGVSREAGITARHFYEHFASVEELLLGVYEDVLERHRGSVAAALQDAPADDLEAVLHAAVAAALAAWTSDPQAARIAFVEVVGFSARVEARRLQAIAEYTEIVGAIAADLHRRGLSAGPPRPLAARALVGAMIGLVEAWLTVEPRPATDDLVAEAILLARASVSTPLSG